jgi:hypothetical protein
MRQNDAAGGTVMRREQGNGRRWAGGDRVPRMWSHALGDDVLVPEPALPAQVYHLWHHSGAMSPERALALAVLVQAVTDIRRYQETGLRHHQRLHDAAYDWMASGERHWPYAFANLCDAFGLVADDVRRELAARAARAHTAGAAAVSQAA